MGHLTNTNSMENSIRIEIYSNSIKLSMSDCSSSSPLEKEIEKPLLWTIAIVDIGLFISCNGKYVLDEIDDKKRDVSCLKSWVAKFGDSLFGRKAIRFPGKNALSTYYRSKPSGIYYSDN